MVVCLGRDADLHMGQLMPLPFTISCSSKSKLALHFWYRLTWVVPDKGPLNGCSSSSSSYHTDKQTNKQTKSTNKQKYSDENIHLTPLRYAGGKNFNSLAPDTHPQLLCRRWRIRCLVRGEYFVRRFTASVLTHATSVMLRMNMHSKAKNF